MKFIYGTGGDTAGFRHHIGELTAGCYDSERWLTDPYVLLIVDNAETDDAILGCVRDAFAFARAVEPLDWGQYPGVFTSDVLWLPLFAADAVLTGVDNIGFASSTKLPLGELGVPELLDLTPVTMCRRVLHARLTNRLTSGEWSEVDMVRAVNAICAAASAAGVAYESAFELADFSDVHTLPTNFNAILSTCTT